MKKVLFVMCVIIISASIMGCSSKGKSSNGSQLSNLLSEGALNDVKMYDTTLKEVEAKLDKAGVEYTTRKESNGSVVALSTCILDKVGKANCYYEMFFYKKSSQKNYILTTFVAKMLFKNDDNYRQALKQYKEKLETVKLDNISSGKVTDDSNKGMRTTSYVYPTEKLDISSFYPVESAKAEYINLMSASTIFFDEMENDIVEIPKGYLKHVILLTASPCEKQEYLYEILKKKPEKKAVIERDQKLSKSKSDEKKEELPKNEVSDVKTQLNWKDIYNNYFKQCHDICYYELFDLNKDGIPEVFINKDSSGDSNATSFVYINKNNEIQESKSGSISFNGTYISICGSIGGVGPDTVVAYNRNNGNYDVVFEGSRHWVGEDIGYEHNGKEYTSNEYDELMKVYISNSEEIFCEKSIEALVQEIQNYN